MALKMYSRGMLDNASTFTEKRLEDLPILAASRHGNAAAVGRSLGFAGAKTIKTEDPHHNIAVRAMPNVMGFDAPTAVKILEEQGVNVRLQGSGRVVSQSLPPGSELRKGAVVTLSLKV
jgi:hypothetical protein